jgi:hypothetical protein
VGSGRSEDSIWYMIRRILTELWCRVGGLYRLRHVTVDGPTIGRGPSGDGMRDKYIKYLLPVK